MDRFMRFGLCPAEDQRKAFSSALPLVLLPLVNVLFLFFSGESFDLIEDSAELLRLALWVFVEEAVFRGFLPVLLSERLSLGVREAALLSAAVFALLHFLNMLAGEAFPFAAAQVMLAFAAGFSFSGLTALTKSFFPGYTIHVLLNITSFSSDKISAAPYVVVWSAVSVLCLLYGAVLFHAAERQAEEEVEEDQA